MPDMGGPMGYRLGASDLADTGEGPCHHSLKSVPMYLRPSSRAKRLDRVRQPPVFRA